MSTTCKYLYEKNKQKLQLRITRNDHLTPQLGMHLLKIYQLTIGSIRLHKNSLSENRKQFKNFHDFFIDNATIENNEIY